MHMQSPAIPHGSWEIAVPNGRYSVTASVGDAAPNYDSSHVISVEGQTLVANFVPNTTTRFVVATALVNVADGRLTLNATGGTNTKLDYVTIMTAPTSRPNVTGVTPATRATSVHLDAPVSAEVQLPNAGFGIDAATLTSSTVRLVRMTDESVVPANLNTSGGGDVILLQPTTLLAPDTEYRFEVGTGVKDLSGAAFLPYSTTFTTGTAAGGGSSLTGVSFEKISLPTATGKAFTSLTFGPDAKLYAATLDGYIYRFTVNADGTTGAPQVISSLRDANSGARMLVGLAFDPSSTASNLVLWATHSFYAFNAAPDWSGKLTRLSGADLNTVQDYVVGLPRSIRDHATNSVSFGPDGKLYLSQGSNTAMGAADDAWGNRPERLLNAAILRVDPLAITSPPLNVQTESGGTYNPFAGGAPLTIYASGLRNAFDLVWHSNGHLYVPTNGSAAGGNTPGTPSPLPSSCQTRIDAATNGAYGGPQVPGLTNVSLAQDDFLFRVQAGGYYGHPNPRRCEWVLNGGNPTSGTDASEIGAYPVGTLPDRNWRGAAWSFGLHYSPNGVVEYKNNAFGGALRGKLLVARYSAGDDIIVLTPGGPNLDIIAADTGVPGLTGLTDPLDLVENPANGNLYVSEHSVGRITLMRPIATSTTGRLTLENLDGVPFPDRLAFSRIGSVTSPPANGVHDRATLRLRNTGTGPLSLTGLPISGPWQLVSPPALPLSIAAGASVDLVVRFVAATGRVSNGTLTVQSNDPFGPSRIVQLSGYWQSLPENNLEPSLTEIVGIFGYQTAIVGSGQVLNQNGLVTRVGDEVISPFWLRVDSTKPVTVRQLDAFHTQNSTATLFWHARASTSTLAVVTHAASDAQTLLPRISGSTTAPAQGTFSPTGSFGLKVDTEWSDPTRNDQTADRANGCPGPCGHHVRFWPVKDRAGVIIPHTWLVAMDYSGINYDYNDNVYLVTNMEPDGDTLYRLDVAASGNYTDANGRVWSPDTGFFTPATAVAEGANVLPLEIANTADDVVYRTYRGNVGQVPLDQRVLSYALPTTAQRVNVRLHFAERCSCNNAVGRRLFSVTMENNVLSDNLDIFKLAGGLNSALVVPYYGVAVTDGTLNIVLRAQLDYPSIAGIEVLAAP